jgi:hypothetical protein
MTDYASALIDARIFLANLEQAAALGNIAMALVYLGEAEVALKAVGLSLVEFKQRQEKQRAS